MRLSANLSLMFTEVALPERFALARQAGFDCVEIQFPYEYTAQALHVAAAGLPIDLINVPAGAPERGYLGLATDAGQGPAFAAAVDQALRYAEALQVRKLNILCGAPHVGQTETVTRAHVVRTLRAAAGRLQRAGIAGLVEMINPFDAPGFWLGSLAKALDVLREVDHPNLRLQFDLYHMARTEIDLVGAIELAGPRIGHVQFADNPGRQEPGTGGINFDAALAALRRAGYAGVVAAEYRPRDSTLDSLGWMAAWGHLHKPTKKPADEKLA